MTSVVGEMPEWTVEFSTELYRAQPCDPIRVQVLFAELPKRSLAQRDEMDIPLLSNELAEAITQMSTGVDGLPILGNNWTGLLLRGGRRVADVLPWL